MCRAAVVGLMAHPVTLRRPLIPAVSMAATIAMVANMVAATTAAAANTGAATANGP